MTRATLALTLAALSGAWLIAQETKPVPKGAVRVSIPGCAKGAAFTTVRPSTDQPGTYDVPAGVHMHMNGAKPLMAEIKAHQEAMIEITGTVRKDDLRTDGINVKGVRISPGPSPSSAGGTGGVPLPPQIQIDVESWRQISGTCPR
ncbi:MAG TPA: hypothetical protein VJN96_24985 [Vicinamibacterales bacterium]|nr:hypothetical protein [Vicinamibacterales bacterium]